MLFTGVSWIKCDLNQYLSGLAFSIDPIYDKRLLLVDLGGVLTYQLDIKREGCFAGCQNLCEACPGFLQWLTVPARGNMDRIRITYENYPGADPRFEEGG